jgi:hypothetical protein
MAFGNLALNAYILPNRDIVLMNGAFATFFVAALYMLFYEIIKGGLAQKKPAKTLGGIALLLVPVLTALPPYIMILSQSTITYTVTGLTNGVSYTFEARAVNGDEVTKALGEVQITPQETPAPETQPDGQELIAAAGDSQVTLSWPAPKNGDPTITGYEVSYGSSEGYTQNWQSTAPDPEAADQTPKLGLAYILTLLLPGILSIEGGPTMVLIALLFYIFRKNRHIQIASLVAVSALVFFASTASPQWMMVFAAIPIFFYNGEKGKGMKNFFYIFYPAHIYGLYIIATLLG